MKEVKILFFNIDSILNKSKKKVIKKELTVNANVNVNDDTLLL